MSTSIGAAVRIDITNEFEGDTIRRRLAIKNADGTARNIANDTIRADFLFTAGTVTLTEGSGITVVDAATGIIDIELTKTQTDAAGAAPSGGYEWGIKLEDSDTKEFTLGEGVMPLRLKRVE